MRKRLWLAGLCVQLCFSVWAQKQTALQSAINQKADSVFSAGKFPGLLLGILHNGKEQYFSFGYAVPEQKLPFDSATLFEMGSITKTFTAFVVQSVLDQKKITDTTSILSYLPDSLQDNAALQGISFRSLLNHTSGLPRLPANLKPKDPMQPYIDYGGQQLFAYLKTAKPVKAGVYSYSNLGMGLAGVLAQRISGKSFEALLEQYINKPFRIVPTPKNAVKSIGYFNGTKAPYWDMAALTPAGGLKCNAVQLMQYLSVLGRPQNKNQLAFIDRLLQPTLYINKRLSIAKGWHLIQEGEQKIYWHNGGTYGFSTFAAFERTTGNAVVVVINKFNANEAADALGVEVIRKLMSERK